MIGVTLKKTVLFSLLGHLTVFGIFSFSFGNNIPRMDCTSVSFLGSILSGYDLTQPFFTPQGYCEIEKAGLISSQNLNTQDRIIKQSFINKPDMLALDKTSREYKLTPSLYAGDRVISNPYLKPTVNLLFNKDKVIFASRPTLVSMPPVRKDSVIMFYPHLPAHFLLYFRDRHVVHIELMFNIISNNKTNSIVIKRKISSGNLEADLLSMRYIAHYLFIQQADFPPNNWQTVKIDLRPKNVHR